MSASGRGLAHGKVVRGTQVVRSVQYSYLSEKSALLFNAGGGSLILGQEQDSPGASFSSGIDRSEMGALCSGMKSHFEGARKPAALLPFSPKILRAVAEDIGNPVATYSDAHNGEQNIVNKDPGQARQNS